MAKTRVQLIYLSPDDPGRADSKADFELLVVLAAPSVSLGRSNLQHDFRTQRFESTYRKMRNVFLVVHFNIASTIISHFELALRSR
jgi:hypothetical protein